MQKGRSPRAGFTLYDYDYSNTSLISCALILLIIKPFKSSTTVRNVSLSYVAEWSAIAHNRPTVQSPPDADDAVSKVIDGSDSKDTDGAVSKAVDGILRTRHGDCTVVGPAKDPWWSVDLGKVYDVNGVSITTAENQSGSAVT